MEKKQRKGRNSKFNTVALSWNKNRRRQFPSKEKTFREVTNIFPEKLSRKIFHFCYQTNQTPTEGKTHKMYHFPRKMPILFSDNKSSLNIETNQNSKFNLQHSGTEFLFLVKKKQNKTKRPFFKERKIFPGNSQIFYRNKQNLRK